LEQKIYKLRDINTGKYFKGTVWNYKNWRLSKLGKTWTDFELVKESLNVMRINFDSELKISTYINSLFEPKINKKVNKKVSNNNIEKIEKVNPHNLEIVEYVITELKTYKE